MGNKLKYGGLSCGSRVIMVAVKAVFCPKSIKTVRFLLVFDTFSMAAHWQRRCFVSDDSTGGQSPVPSIIFQISMRTIKILMILMLVSLPAMAFTQKVDTVVVSHDSSQVLQIIVTIDNTDNEALWILLKNKK